MSCTVNTKEKITTWSFFSGAMGLDLGFERAGLPAHLCVEINPKCCETIHLNRPTLTLIQRDITELDGDMLREISRDAEVDLIIGGPPCQSFSTGGNRIGLSDPRGNLIYEYLRIINDIRPRFFVLENVANLVTAAIRHRPIDKRPGKKWNLSAYSNSNINCGGDAPPLKPDEMSGTAIRKLLGDIREIDYSINFGILDAAEYGAPQHRRRFFLLGAREGLPPALPTPEYGPNSPLQRPFITLKDSISDLQHDPGAHSNYGEFMAKFYSMVPPGGNWRDLPECYHLEALGPSFYAGGGKTGFFRRLSWDEPAPTITGKPNRKATGLCHPRDVRPLSVRECACIQGFPEEWVFAGSMHDAYTQIGNAVPVQLSRAVAGSVANALTKGITENAKELDEEMLLEKAIRKLREAARVLGSTSS